MIAEHRFWTRAATALAVAALPLWVFWLDRHGHALWLSCVIGVALAASFRGVCEVAFKHIFEPAPLSLDADANDRAEDALRRRRIRFWTGKLKLAALYLILVGIHAAKTGAWDFGWPLSAVLSAVGSYWQFAVIFPIYFVFNFLILMGPMMMMGVSQMRGLEPGDADFGVRLEDVRGQKEAKEEIRKVVNLWQAGEHFAAHGGKRERGMLFLGAPGTGKTMLAKAIATGFNCPIVLMPGSGFAQTFIGMDVIVVRYMARKARKLAAKWGGSCIVFIDEIDAVGLRRQGVRGTGESRVEQMPGGGMFGGMGMGQLALQSLLVVMDGIDNPPFLRRVLTNKVNLWLDASFLVPQTIAGRSLRVPKAKPTGNQIYFVGATNMPLEALDPALVRAGRMGRHIHFREPTKRDRLDIFDLYLGKVAHDPALDTEHAREELARVTAGYSPAKIEQVCSIALTYAHHAGRDLFSRDDILEAMVTVEAGTALGWGYETDEEEYATAIHEAGHAITSYLYEKGMEAVRLSVKRRGQTGGHLQSVETVERFAQFKSELYGRLITILGAYAAELVCYGENTQGVGGDLGQASYLAGTMVGRWGMAPEDEGIAGSERRFERIGKTLLAAAGPNDVKLAAHDLKAEAVILGQAFVVAYNACVQNEEALHKIAKTLCRKKEVYGDDLQALLDSCGLEEPFINYDEEETWPQL